MNIRYPIYEGVYRILTVRPEKRAGFCLKVLSPAEIVFSKYPIDDRFESSPSYHTLTVELTGFIQFYIEQYGI